MVSFIDKIYNVIVTLSRKKGGCYSIDLRHDGNAVLLQSQRVCQVNDNFFNQAGRMMGAVKISGITALLSFIYIHTKPQWITQTIILDIQRHKRSFIVQLLNNQGLTKKYSITAVNAPKIID